MCYKCSALAPDGKLKWPPGDTSSNLFFKYSSLKFAKLFRNLSSLFHSAYVMNHQSYFRSLPCAIFPARHSDLLSDLLSCNFFSPCFSKSLIALPESYLQENSPSRALRLQFSKKALLFAVISEANSRLGASTQVSFSGSLFPNIQRRSERLGPQMLRWDIFPTAQLLKHHNYTVMIVSHICFVLEILHSPSFSYICMGLCSGHSIWSHIYQMMIKMCKYPGFKH